MIYYNLEILNEKYTVKTVKQLAEKINQIIKENGINSNFITHHILTRMICKNIKASKWDFINIEKVKTRV